MVELSIIIPIFNVENYLEETINSLINQKISIEKYEILLINDGSTDGSKIICEKYSNTFKNIYLFNIKNKGVSFARNTGIEYAKGKYLMFVDGDDKVIPNTIHKLLKHAINKEYEVISMSFASDNGGLKAFDEHIVKETNGIDYYLNYRLITKTYDSSCTYLYSKTFLNRNNLFYNENAVYIEDGEFIAKVFTLANNCLITNYPIYAVTIRKGSAMRSNLMYKDKTIKGVISSTYSLNIIKNKISQENKHNDVVIRQALIKFCTLALELYVVKFKLKKFFETYKKFLEDHIIPLNYKDVTMDFDKKAIKTNKGYISCFIYFCITRRINELISLSRQGAPWSKSGDRITKEQ